MRLSTYLLLPALTTALQFGDFLSAFSATIEDFLPGAFSVNETQPHDLLKRQFSNTCPENFNDCASLGAPGLCCAQDAICSPDAAGHVACCPSGAVCTGTIGGVITEGTVNSVGSLISPTPVGQGTSSFVFAGTTGSVQMATTPTATSGQFVPSTTGSGFIIDGTSTVARPGAAVRGVEVPMIAKLIVRMLGYLRI